MNNKLISFIILIVFITIFKSFIKFIMGDSGENQVKKSVKLIHKKNKQYFKLLNNILLPAKDNFTTQIDHILINNYGIFVIETKNYSALQVVGHENNKYWTTYYRNNSYQLYNPVRQNEGHIIAIKKIIKTVPINNRVVFVKNTDLSGVVSSNVFNLSNLNMSLFSSNNKVISNKDIDNIYNNIKQFNSMSFFNNINHIFKTKYIRHIKR